MVGRAWAGKPAFTNTRLTSGFDRKGPWTLRSWFGLTSPVAAVAGKAVAARQSGAWADNKTTRVNQITAVWIVQRATMA
jgi:hypothetical protein